LFFFFFFFFCFFFFNTIFILHSSVSSISVVSRVRTPALILAPEQRLVIEPNTSIHSLCYLLCAFSFILHVSFYSSSFLAVSLFVCPFSFIPVNLFQTYGPQWNPVSSNLLMISSPNRFPSQTIFWCFPLDFAYISFSFCFPEIHNKLRDFSLSFLKSSFLTTIDGTHSRLESL